MERRVKKVELKIRWTEKSSFALNVRNHKIINFQRAVKKVTELQEVGVSGR